MTNQLTQRQKQAISTKLKILKTAMSLFKKEGYNNIKVVDICEAADISVGAFYHHFSSKNDIVSTGYRQVDRLLQERYQSTHFDSNLDRIRFLLGEGGAIIEDIGWDLVSEVYKNLLSHHDPYTFSDDRFVYRKLEECIEAALGEGEIIEISNKKELIKTLLKFGRGTIFDWCLNEGGYNLKETMIKDIDYILACFLPNKRIINKL